MFTILSVQSKPEQERLCGLVNTKFRADAPAYALTVDDKFAGLCQFRMQSGYGEILSLDCVDSFKGNADGTKESYIAALCRTALSFMEQLGTPEAVYNGKDYPDAQLELCGFSEEDNGTWNTNLKTLFKTCPSSGKTIG